VPGGRLKWHQTDDSVIFGTVRTILGAKQIVSCLRAVVECQILTVIQEWEGGYSGLRDVPEFGLKLGARLSAKGARFLKSLLETCSRKADGPTLKAPDRAPDAFGDQWNGGTRAAGGRVKR